jgi:demethoxyubiquinone hydroxylase (CLK1/Coq7/Cat5 family)
MAGRASLWHAGENKLAAAARAALVRTDPTVAERRLIAVLQAAHAGELAAAYAYRGHARSVRGADRDRIRVIEREEWEHRASVGQMLAALGQRPVRWRQIRQGIVGRVMGALCNVSGWLAPMFGAAYIESRNIREYESAARFAWACGRRDWVGRILEMAEVEWEHEAYFRGRVLSRRLGRRLPMWPAPPSKDQIRASFEADAAAPLA